MNPQANIPASSPTARVSAPPTSSWGVRTAMAAALGLGLLVRIHLVLAPPISTMMWDHHEYVAWAVLMDREGFTALYDHPPGACPMWDPRTGRAATTAPGEEQVCNYPPGFALPLYAAGRLLKAVQPDMASNTPTARALFSVLAIVCDVLTALGCYVLVRQEGGGTAGAIAFVVAILAPPFFLDSCTWGQTDSCVLAPAVWMLWAMTRRRWLLAGGLWGITLALKTQGALLAPVWLFVLLVDSDRRRVIAGGVLAGVVLFASGVPFLSHSGLAWFGHSYVRNLLHHYPLTTLKAFNVWYVDLLLCEDTDASLKLLGVEKDTWGKLLLAAGLVASSAWLFRTRRRRPHVLVRFAAVWLLLTVILPTRVHERYIVLALPFLICTAAVCRRVWWGLAPLIVAATFQVAVFDWLRVGADHWSRFREKVRPLLRDEYEQYRRTLPPERFAALPPPDVQLMESRTPHAEYRREVGDAPREWALTLLELLAAGWCLAFAIPGCRGEPCGEAPPRAGPTTAELERA